MSHLRWDLTPQTMSPGKNGTYEVNGPEDFERFKQLLAEKAGYFFYVDVWNCQARLALMKNDEDGGGKSEVITDFESPLLRSAVYQVGGSITTSGWYPLSSRLKNLLKKRLGV